MPKRAKANTPEGQALLQSLYRLRDGDAYGAISPPYNPLSDLLTDALNRASALERKNTPITWAEKERAFSLMGFDPVPKQRLIAMDLHPIRVVRAGRRSGKTTLAAHEAAAVMISKPGSFGWIVAPDYELAFRCWEILIAELEKLEARGLLKFKVKQNSPSSMRVVLDNGSAAEGKSAEIADDLQGVGLDWLIIDEIGQILPFVFLQFLFPAVAERNGWSFLIGTPIGENWTEKEVRQQKRDAAAKGIECAWSEHLFETWHNLKAFPGGRSDPKILLMERTMPFEEFMEQVCARPQRSRYVTYKEFDEDVHVRTCKFDPSKPVQISIDPSTGVNPYAVGVFQDHGELVMMIDEYYRMSVLATDVIDTLAEQAWWENVEEAIIDDAWPQERETWRRHPKVNFGVRRAGKSAYIQDSIPTVRNWLRDPLKYNALVIPMRDEIIQELFPGKEWLDLEIPDQQQVMLRVELAASDRKDLLLDCARFFVDRHCLNVIDEFTGYSYKKRKRDDQNPSENPIDFKNHLMDALRYYLWRRKRSYGLDRARPESYVNA